MTDKTIEAYIAKHPDWRGATMRALHALVLERAPQATHGIKWAQPVYEHNGPMIFMKAATKHVTFGFWRGAELDDPQGLLEGEGERMKHLKLREGPLPVDALAAFVAQAVRLNEEKGSPAKRG